jgi:hypothetical protein
MKILRRLGVSPGPLASKGPSTLTCSTSRGQFAARPCSQLAPTRLALAGAAAGLVGGATGATAYALHCVETSPAFVLVWYSLGLAATSAPGALLGRRMLHW